MATATRPSKGKRFNIRATPRQRELIRSVAERRGTTMSAFVIQSAVLQAEQILSEERHFTLTASKWDAFVAALDRPIQNKPRLQKLFSEKTILDQ